MAEFVNVPEETDPDVIAQDIYELLESKVSTWTARDTELDTWIIDGTARILATLKNMASETRIGIFRFFGASVFNLPPVEGSKASSTCTIKLSDAAGHTLPIGTQIGVPNAAGVLIPFETTAEVIVPEGSEVTATGGVPIQAKEEGSEASGLGTSGTVCVLQDQYPWIPEGGILLHATTGGGNDEETDAEYLNRLVVEIRLWAPRPITPNDFADISRNIPGVGRALAINLYNPETKTSNNEKTITIALEDGNGNTVSGPTKAQVKLYLEEKREVNFIIFVIDPTYEQIDVEYEVNHWEGFEPESVKARCQEAMEEFLRSQTWGLPPFGDRKAWYNREEVTINDIVAALGQVQGVKDVLSVKIRKHATGAYEVKNVKLEGVAALAKAGTITGTVI